ncbi:hypothetical protein CLOM_g9507, partial [Closterium sp. NIES-68]
LHIEARPPWGEGAFCANAVFTAALSFEARSMATLSAGALCADCGGPFCASAEHSRNRRTSSGASGAEVGVTVARKM